MISEKDHAAVSYFYLNSKQNAYGGGNIPFTINQSFAKQTVVNIEVATFMYLQSDHGQPGVWFTFTRVAGGRVNLPTLGMDDLGTTFTTQGPKTLPQLANTRNISAGGALAGPTSNTSFYSLRDMVSKVEGKHSLDFDRPRPLWRRTQSSGTCTTSASSTPPHPHRPPREMRWPIS